jgi:signal transduction histidine kinase
MKGASVGGFFMKVARTLTVFLGIVALLVMSGLTAVLVVTELGSLRADMENDHDTISGTLAPVLGEEWTKDRTAAAAMLERVDHHGVELHLRDERDLPADAVARIARDGAAGLAEGGYLRTWRRLPVPEPVYLEVRESESAHYQWVQSLLVRVLMSAFALLITFVVVASVMGRRIIGLPVERLVSFAQRFGRGDFSVRVGLQGANELGELGRQLDVMADTLLAARERLAREELEKRAAEERLHHAERLATVGKLAAGIAHEMGTPLSVVGTWGRMIATGEVAGDEVAKGGQIVADEAAVMTNIIRQLLDFARRRMPQRGDVELNVLLGSTIRLIGTLASRRNVTLVHRETPALVAQVDQVQVQQVLTNLVINAVQSFQKPGTVTVFADTMKVQAPADVDPSRTERTWAVIHVVDEGAGIAPEVMSRIFEPFFTTKEVGEGTGLGLSVSWSIVRDHGGWIDVQSVVGKGTHFSVFLPG